MAKIGLDAHYVGVVMLTRALRDAGMEVVYTGLFQTPEKVVRAAMQEDVDIIGLSFLSGAYLHYTGEVVNLLDQENLRDLPVLVGGIIPEADVPKLKQIGASEVFPADTPVSEIISYIQNLVPE